MFVAHAAIANVVDEIGLIVPDELVAQDADERSQRRGGDDKNRHTADRCIVPSGIVPFGFVH